MPTLKELTVETLSHLAASGTERLPVDDEARGILREWMLAARAGKKAGQGTAAAPAPAVAPAPVAAAPAAAPQEKDEMGTEEKLAYLRKRAENWKPARALGSLRDTMVFAVGNPHARLMLVGEAPGFDEERLGEPFVGKAGQLLNKILAAMGLKREEVYISNVCKWRPSMGENQGTGNRAPSPEEIAACLPLIMAEIRAVRPACIICLGASSAKGLLQRELSVGSARGQWLECQGVPVRVTYHPSYLLRNENLSARRAVWEDMLAAMELLGMPISDKQRGYFRS